ncbi:MAG TPA: DoxX family protein [Candidatus Paceibacterota bacterium]|nr:DoxX family protein [Verrucomicrobiota bacterium]HSA12432.1 DoxX family protein [Candidatus Paceibacterota bacterium]
MSASHATDQRKPWRIAALLGRWLLGGLFICLGLINVVHGAEFLIFVRQQLRVTDPVLSSLFAQIAPWLQVLYGLLVLSGIARNAAAVIARWWLGILFIFMGLNKAFPHPEAFLKLVRQYDMVANPFLLNAIGAALPWFEVYCGALLLLGVAVRGAALNVVAMLVPFTLIVLKRALAIAATTGIPFCAVKFDCGCGAGEVFICHKLVENTVLLLLSVWLLAGHGRKFSLRFSLVREKEEPVGKVG